MNESAKRDEENSNMIKKIQASTDAAIRNQGALIKTLEIQIGQMSKVLQEKGFGSLPSSTETNPRDHVKSISTANNTDTTLICHIRSTRYAISDPQNSKLFSVPSQMTIPFPFHLNDCCCDDKKGSYGLQYLDTYSYGATHLNDSLPQKEKDLGSFTLPCYINNICFKKALADLAASVNVMPLSTYLNLGLGELAHTKLTVELADRTVKHPKGIAEIILVGIGKFVFPVDFIILNMPEDINVYLILGRSFLSTVHDKIDVFKRKITLRVGDEKIIFKSVKPASSLIRRIYMLSLRERTKLDLEARLMGETLILNRSLDPLYGVYIELNDLNEPLELRRNQVDDLEPTIEEDKVVDKPMFDEVKTRNDGNMISRLNGYPSYCDFDKRIHIDYKIEFKGRNELGNFVNAPVFIGNFYGITNFTIVEDTNPYLDEGMGDVIVGEPFCKALCVEPRIFNGIITICDGDNSVTYQMMWSNARFKHLTNEKCNKIPSLLKVSEQDKMNEISHSYQKLKGFYKGVLNLEPKFIRDAKGEEWLTRGHISVHEMKLRRLKISLT
ncbi:retrovirus-related pol polyprotein from transposon TNT 1-94 [Tanacetum coccineum]